MMASNSNVWMFWKKNNEKICLVVLIIVFFISALFIALNLKPGIIPDEPAHFVFSKHYSTTLGIPEDTYDTYRFGWYIWQNPFLYYWIMGRVINLTTLINPSITDPELLITLRVINTFFAVGTVFFCYQLSSEVIKKKWWRLLPVFFLINILMFVFLAGGVNYDNLANLLSMISIYFFVLSLKQKNFITNSILWMIFIFLGTLVKYPILPLALALSIAWIVALIVKRHALTQFKIRQNHILLLIILTLLLVGNFSIYGVNIIRYQSLTPPCREILTVSQCELSPFVIRHEEIAYQPKLTIAESIELGFPSPIKYIVLTWPYHILSRSIGVIGHQSYIPFHLMRYYQILFYGIIILGLVNLLHYRKTKILMLHLFGIMTFYTITLLINNYYSELTYGFQQISLQGRYIFPIIGIILVLFAYTLMKFPNRIIRWISTGYALGLVMYGGLISFLINFNSVFSGWFF